VNFFYSNSQTSLHRQSFMSLLWPWYRGHTHILVQSSWHKTTALSTGC